MSDETGRRVLADLRRTATIYLTAVDAPELVDISQEQAQMSIKAGELQ